MTTEDQVSITTKYKQTKEAIKSAIRRGEFTGGERLPSIRQMMELYNVSYSTITRSLKELRDAGVVESRWGKGIFVIENQPTVENLAVTFGDMFTSTDHRIVAILRGIDRGVSSAGWHMHLFPLPEGRIFGGGGKHLLATLLRERYVDAVIALSPHPPGDIEQLESMGVPVVCVQNHYPGTATAAVMMDVDDAARQIVRYLVDELGHRRINVVLGPRHEHSALLVRSSTELGRALAREFRARDLGLSTGSVLHSDYSWQTVEPVVRRWLSSPDRPTAILLCDQALADHTVRLAQEEGLVVPDDLSVVGYADRRQAAELTGMSLPLARMGQDAVQLLQQMLAGQPPVLKRVPGEFAVRESCAPPKAPDAETP